MLRLVKHSLKTLLNEVLHVARRLGLDEKPRA
jgi:hypothetical protein